jgi:hypothetical protein
MAQKPETIGEQAARWLLTAILAIIGFAIYHFAYLPYRQSKHEWKLIKCAMNRLPDGTIDNVLTVRGPSIITFTEPTPWCDLPLGTRFKRVGDQICVIENSDTQPNCFGIESEAER